MNDIMLYTYPQQDGKYRLKNTLSLSGMKVKKLYPSLTKSYLIANLNIFWLNSDVFLSFSLSLSLSHTHTHTHTHRWANLSWTMCWTVLGSRCLTSLLRSQPGELLMAKILKWSAWIWWWLAQDSPPLIWSNAFRSKALESAVIVCLSLSSVQSERGRTGSTRWVEP